MQSTIIYLIGHYGVGKLTIAKAICAMTDARLFDNHLVNNVVFSLIRMDGNTGLPEKVWDYIDVIKDQAFASIETLAPPDFSYVLTNALMDDDPGDWAAYEKVQALAARTGRLFVPVLLNASDEAHAARIDSEDRRARLKATNVAAAAEKRRNSRLIQIEHPNRIDIDTTHLPPEQAARIIIDHAETCR
ncbi:hypothetical protein GCM10007989_28540 [Devosia pacifica]|uniref:Shikimate kinase n=1 Tax=Devosia pacifica TaxID=1335967 RepID=A0A918S9V8_9HYPH|nr:hypothetical protein [Devosia pacifica]GHA30899.1 hypothetical protein GCM10007989_28540 [Devosia pacifica]